MNGGPVALKFVSDGPRDAATLPPLVAGLLGVGIRSTGFRQWTKLVLPRGSGYLRKLKFAMREAIDEGAEGLVATVDRDRSPSKSRLSELEDARRQERSDPKSPVAALPVALGEADPHAEAWLLDDAHAVRTALRLAAKTEIPTVRQAHPKNTVDDLCAKSRPDEAIMELLAEIAGAVNVQRCAHTKETGFHRFAQEVDREIAPLRRH